MVKPVARQDPYTKVSNRIDVVKRNREEEQEQKKVHNAGVAQKIFNEKGITEESINEYGKMTGDAETTQKMLENYQNIEREKQFTDNLKDTHISNMLSHAVKQDEIVDDAYTRASAFFSNINLSDTSPENVKKINQAWQFFRENDAPNFANYDEKGNLVRGMQMPETPDINWISNMVQRGKDHKTQMEETKLNYDNYFKEKEFKLREKGIIAKAKKDETAYPDIDPITLTAARRLAYEIGKSRGAKDVMPDIIAGIRAGYKIDEIGDQSRYQLQSDEFEGAARTAIQQIVATKSISETKKKSILDEFDDVVQSGNPESIAEYLKRTARTSAPGATEIKIEGAERTVEFLNEIQNDIKEYEKLGGKTNIFSGSFEEVNKKIGRVSDPKLRTIATKIQKAIQGYQHDVSGASFTLKESDRYKDMFPSISRTGEFNTATTKALVDAFSGDIEKFYRNAMGNEGYETFILKKASTSGKTDDELLDELFPGKK